MSDLVFTRDLSSEFAYKAINEPKGEFKRFHLGNVSETMSDKKLKATLGGYGGYDEYEDYGDKLCWRYCYEYDNKTRTASTTLPSCYDHYAHCTQAGWLSKCDCFTGP